MERDGAPPRPAGVRIVLLSLIAAAVLVACGPAPSPTQTAPEVAAATVSGQGVTLAVTADPAVATPGERIDVEAVVTNDGDEPLVLSGSGGGFVFFSVTRIEDGLTSGEPAMTDDCVPHVVAAGEPAVVPFAKSGGWTEEDPNADFLRTYFADPELSLPAGTWRIDVSTAATIGEGCVGPRLELAASVVVQVTE